MTDVVVPIHREASTIPFRLVRLLSIWKVVDYLKNVEMTPKKLPLGTYGCLASGNVPFRIRYLF
jgi:hypothetical protein